MKQIASQELQADKLRMQEWKQKVMSEVVHELHVMKAAQTEAMEAQRQSFQMQLVEEERRKHGYRTCFRLIARL